MITKEMIDFILLAFSQTDEQSWFNWSEFVLDYCDKFLEGEQLTDDEVYEIKLCYDVLQDDDWDYVKKEYK